MGHYHKHHHEPVISGRNLLIATILNFIITAAEVIGGILSNSLALLSDALHNFSDGIAVLIAYIANKVSKRPSNVHRTFGYKRIEILAAFFNAIILIVIIIYLFYESVLRFYEPEPIKGLIMMLVAIIGLLANLFAVLLLRKDSKVNLNVRSAYLHLMGDTLSSIAVIIGGILIYLYEVFWVDPLITILVGIYLIRETWIVLKETVDILMQSTPRNIDLDQVQAEIEKLDPVKNIHHVHIWSLSDSMIHFECHVDLIEDLHVSQTENLLRQIEKILHDQFEIHHTTIQVEYNVEDKKAIII